MKVIRCQRRDRLPCGFHSDVNFDFYLHARFHSLKRVQHRKTERKKMRKKERKGRNKREFARCVLSHSWKRESEAQPAAEFCAVLPETELDSICAGKLSSTSPFVAAAQEVITFSSRLQCRDVKRALKLRQE